MELGNRRNSSNNEVIGNNSIFRIIPSIVKKFLPSQKVEKCDEKQTDNVFELAKLPEYSASGIFTETQFNNFVSKLSRSELMNEEEKEFFKEMWHVLFWGYGFDGLKVGTFDIARENKDNTKSKLSWNVKKYEYKNALPWVMYEHNDDKFIVLQHDKNNEIFMLLTSNYSSERFLNAMKEEGNKTYTF